MYVDMSIAIENNGASHCQTLLKTFQVLENLNLWYSKTTQSILYKLLS